jgi:hypothetical protein
MSVRAPYIFALLCCVALLGGCASSKPATGGTTPGSQPGAAAPAEKPNEPGKVGDRMTAGPYQFWVDSVSVKPVAPGRAGDIQPPAGKEFLWAQVNVYNGGQTPLTVTPEMFSLKDASGAEIKTTGDQGAYNANDMQPLPPKYSTNTALVYAVDPGSKGYVLTFTPQVSGTKTPVSVTLR